MAGKGKEPTFEEALKGLESVVARLESGEAPLEESIRLFEEAEAGDEPRFLAETLPGVPVLTGRARKFPARCAVELGADVLVLDDGFQHLALKRDINLVLFHADTLAGNSRVFPGGDPSRTGGGLAPG